MQLLLKLLFIYSVLFHHPHSSANPVDNTSIKPPTENKQVSMVQNKPDENKVNINLATLDQLQTLPGIGPKRAEAIIDYRTKNGPFTSVEELAKVKGFNEQFVRRLLKENPDKITI